jgi:hypothetical protein
MTARRTVLSLVLFLSATGCSGSSSGSPNQGQGGGDDSGGGSQEPGGPDATTTNNPPGDGGSSPNTKDGGDASSPPGTGDSGSTSNAAPAGDAGVAAFCNAVCSGLLQCAAGMDAGPCHCNAGSFAAQRTDYISGITACAAAAIEADCDDAGAAVQGCELSGAVAITPTPAAATFCKDLELSLCAGTLPNCLTNAGVYSDQSIAAFAACFMDLPDADVAGGCTNFANCLQNASP